MIIGADYTGIMLLIVLLFTEGTVQGIGVGEGGGEKTLS